ncbi:MAG: hypothetical protein KDA05_01350 [Phycisphaerales bacterium]|nr:hypothetical protein [Phycisphaerales bacterium]
MTRQQLEHILRASNAITGAPEIVVIGSQAVHARGDVAAPTLVASMEADVFTFRSPDDAELIDGTIGEESPFHRTFGYYAHGVGPETAVLPEGWKDRLVPLRTPGTGGATGLCLEVHDLAVSKLVAGREKDLAFVAALLQHGLADGAALRERLAATTLDDSRRRACEERLGRLTSRP